MSRYDDDWAVMDDAFGSDGEWGSPSAAPAAVTAFIDDLRGLADAEPPEPSVELAALLAGDAPLPRRPATRRLQRRRVVGVVAASVLIGGTGVAAADGRLPQPAQRFVSDVVNNLTPFTVPAKPDEPVPSPGGTPGSTRAREHSHPVVPVPEPSEGGAEGRSGEPAGEQSTEPADSATSEARDDGGAATGVRGTEPTHEATGAGGGERQGSGGREGGDR